MGQGTEHHRVKFPLGSPPFSLLWSEDSVSVSLSLFSIYFLEIIVSIAKTSVVVFLEYGTVGSPK
jgi:hypothetical protein